MRTFRCLDCEHTWELPFGSGGRGSELLCPQCGSKAVHRVEQAETSRRRGRAGWRSGAESPGADSRRGQGSGSRRQGWRGSSK